MSDLEAAVMKLPVIATSTGGLHSISREQVIEAIKAHEDQDRAVRAELKGFEHGWKSTGFEPVDSKMLLLTTIEQGPGSSGIRGFIKVAVGNPYKAISGTYDVEFLQLESGAQPKQEQSRA